MALRRRGPYARSMLTSVAIFALVAALEPSTIRLLPPDAGFLLGIEWRQALSSPSGGVLEKRWTGGGELRQIPGMAGLEKTLREDVDSLLVAGSTQDVAARGQEAALLIIIRGRFDRVAIRQWLKGRVETYKNIQVITPAKTEPPNMRVALVDDTTIVAGHRRQVIPALDRLTARTGQVPARLVQRAGELAARHHAWLAIEAPPGGFPSDSGPQAKIAAQLTGLDVGVAFTDGLALEANLQARSDTAARDLATAVQGLVAMAALQQTDSADASELLRKVEVAAGPTAVRLRLSLTPADLQRGFQKSPQMAAAPATPAPGPPRPVGPRKIRIVGLDEGPKEILVK
jgi:hypothetical protein